jgi:exodeoxyribonuclease V alpha subunit
MLTQNLRVLHNPEDRIIINTTNIIQSPYYQAITENNFMIFSAESVSKDVEKLIAYAKLTKETIKDHKFITATNEAALNINEAIVKIIDDGSDYRNIRVYKKVEGSTILKYSVGDPVIFTKNKVYVGKKDNTKSEVYNGTEGIIIKFEYNMMYVMVDDYQVDVKLEGENVFEAKHVSLAYCLSGHKSEGSEYKNVYCFLYGKPSRLFLNQRWIYTVTTRAKKQFIAIESNPGSYEQCARTMINEHHGLLIQRILNKV